MTTSNKKTGTPSPSPSRKCQSIRQRRGRVLFGLACFCILQMFSLYHLKYFQFGAASTTKYPQVVDDSPSYDSNPNNSVPQANDDDFLNSFHENNHTDREHSSDTDWNNSMSINHHQGGETTSALAIRNQTDSQNQQETTKLPPSTTNATSNIIERDGKVHHNSKIEEEDNNENEEDNEEDAGDEDIEHASEEPEESEEHSDVSFDNDEDDLDDFNVDNQEDELDDFIMDNDEDEVNVENNDENQAISTHDSMKQEQASNHTNMLSSSNQQFGKHNNKKRKPTSWSSLFQTFQKHNSTASARQYTREMRIAEQRWQAEQLRWARSTGNTTGLSPHQLQLLQKAEAATQQQAEYKASMEKIQWALSTKNTTGLSSEQLQLFEKAKLSAQRQQEKRQQVDQIRWALYTKNTTGLSEQQLKLLQRYNISESRKSSSIMGLSRHRPAPAWTRIQYNSTQVEEFLQSIQHTNDTSSGQSNTTLLVRSPNATNLHQQHHAFVVPYRDREYHLQEFIKFMNVYLKYHYYNGSFSLWVVEQDDQELFNRAWLGNVGLHQIMQREAHTKCIIFHDVDMIPQSLFHVFIPYHDCDFPLQLAQAKNGQQNYCGGATVLSSKDWQQINGLSNSFVGWGGEDDDLCLRLSLHGLTVNTTTPKGRVEELPRKPPEEQMAFQLISQDREHHVSIRKHSHTRDNKHLLDDMKAYGTRWQHDGLSDLSYNVTSDMIMSNNPPHSSKYAGFDKIHHIKVIQ